MPGFTLNFNEDAVDEKKKKSKHKKEKKERKKSKKEEKRKRELKEKIVKKKRKKEFHDSSSESSSDSDDSLLASPVAIPEPKKQKKGDPQQDELSKLLAQNSSEIIRHSKSDPKKSNSDFTYSAGLTHDLEAAKVEIKEGKKGIIDYKKMNAARQAKECRFCYENPSCDKSLIVAIGNAMYMALPARGMLCAGHCLILPVDHKPCVVDFDENELEDLRNFKKCLIRMFAKEDKTPIFIETVPHITPNRHALIECIPIPNEEYEDAEITYAMEIKQNESEFIQQTNQKKVVMKTQRSAKEVVPTNFPYFCVEFGLEGGLAHLIQDETKWEGFGRSVAGGLLGRDMGGHLSKSERNSTHVQKELPVFLKKWKPFDFTAQLAGGGYE
eukprot:TRINITY_DN67192_c5_g1_i1.p1 TRINITY_DN67192_c5_g1~~TRINITY_DN67192_c5_g1_i1.p1  ORF type:complete len:384 (-),score=37.94 TRINITY_DN67192_c5_g1_i1:88-1239(-)